MSPKLPVEFDAQVAYDTARAFEAAFRAFAETLAERDVEVCRHPEGQRQEVETGAELASLCGGCGRLVRTRPRGESHGGAETG